MMLVAVRIKGKPNVKKEVEKTMQLLKLYKKHSCVILPAKKSVVGMLKKIERYVTWGEINFDVLKMLLQKRGRLPGNKKLTLEYLKDKVDKDFEGLSRGLIDSKIKIKDVPGLKSFFKLKPPTKGFERLGAKKPYSMGGVFGYRGKEINLLLKRMI